MDTTNEAGKAEPITHVDLPADLSADTGDAAGSEADSQKQEKPSLSELAEAGLSAGELEMAKKQGRIRSDGNDQSGDAKKPEPKDVKGGETDGKKEETQKEKSVDERFRVLSKGKSPEQILADVSEKGTLTPEMESVLLAALTQNGKSLYWAQKKERQRRQTLETEHKARQKEVDELRAELAKAKSVKPVDDLGLEEPAEEIDPKKKPLTLEELEKIDAEKAKKIDEESKSRNERALVIKEALDYQQADARTRYSDFDEVLGNHTKKILEAANAGALNELYPDPRQASRIRMKAINLLKAFANPEAFGEEDFDAADLAYELGKEHPEYGKNSKNNVKKTDETGADGDPETAARVITNANRRGSSATLTGGGSRRVTLDELTPDQAIKLPTSKFNKLPKETRERLLRGK